MKELTFNEIPTAIGTLLLKIESLEILMKEMKHSLNPSIEPPEDVWFTTKELSSYLPDKPTMSTLYRRILNKTIPYSKFGKKVLFNKETIDSWMEAKKRKPKLREKVIA